MIQMRLPQRLFWAVSVHHGARTRIRLLIFNALVRCGICLCQSLLEERRHLLLGGVPLVRGHSKIYNQERVQCLSKGRTIIPDTKRASTGSAQERSGQTREVCDA